MHLKKRWQDTIYVSYEIHTGKSQWPGCNGFITIVFASLFRLYLQTKLPSSLMMGYTGKYPTIVKDF